jgi:glutamate-1-semialdehyde 2,1-aminomutase
MSDPANRQAQLLAQAGRTLAGGGLGLFVLPPELNLVVERGQGSRVWDVAGREYIDYHLGSGPALLGHGHPAISAAIAARLDKGTTYFFLNEPEIELAQRLIDAVPCGERVHYAGSGTEATFYALRIARAHTGREKILKFEGAWHGMHDYGLWGTVPSAPSDYPRARPDSVGVPRQTGDTVLVAPFNDSERALALIEAHAQDLAAVIVEPLQRVLLPEPGFLEALREVTQRHGIVLVFDEIVTGFRIAWGGAQERYGVVPDLACWAKAICGGTPGAAFGGRADVMESIDTGAAQQGTFNGNPLVAAAGLATLTEVLTPDAYRHLAGIGTRLAEGCAKAMAEHRIPGHAVDLGAKGCVSYRPEPLANYRDFLETNPELYLASYPWAMNRGIFMTPGDEEQWTLSVQHTEADVDRYVEQFADFCAALAAP